MVYDDCIVAEDVVTVTEEEVSVEVISAWIVIFLQATMINLRDIPVSVSSYEFLYQTRWLMLLYPIVIDLPEDTLAYILVSSCYYQ